MTTIESDQGIGLLDSHLDAAIVIARATHGVRVARGRTGGPVTRPVGGADLLSRLGRASHGRALPGHDDDDDLEAGDATPADRRRTRREAVGCRARRRAHRVAGAGERRCKHDRTRRIAAVRRSAGGAGAAPGTGIHAPGDPHAGDRRPPGEVADELPDGRHPHPRSVDAPQRHRGRDRRADAAHRRARRRDRRRCRRGMGSPPRSFVRPHAHRERPADTGTTARTASA